MDIVIPTFGRPHKQVTLPQLVDAGLHVNLVVQTREQHLYDHWGEWATVWVLPPHITTIAPTRDFIIEHIGKSNEIVMLDDDLQLYIRRNDDRTKLRVPTPTEIALGLSLMDNLLSAYAHVGWAAREGANRNINEFIINTRIMRILGYNRDMLLRENIHFSDIEFMSDFHVNLSLLEKGYKNVVQNSFAHNQGASDAPGGCSTYRTPAGLAASAATLAKLHPGVVKVVQKATKTAWGGGERTDVTIQWKKAYQQSQRK